MRSLGWHVEASQHPGWRGPLRSAAPPRTTADLTGFDVYRQDAAAVDYHCRSAPDGVQDFFYWADASTEVVTLCPSRRTEIGGLI